MDRIVESTHLTYMGRYSYRGMHNLTKGIITTEVEVLDDVKEDLVIKNFHLYNFGQYECMGTFLGLKGLNMEKFTSHSTPDKVLAYHTYVDEKNRSAYNKYFQYLTLEEIQELREQNIFIKYDECCTRYNILVL